MTADMTADEIIAHLDLAPHPEGGHFRQTWVETPAAGPATDIANAAKTATNTDAEICAASETDSTTAVYAHAHAHAKTANAAETNTAKATGIGPATDIAPPIPQPLPPRQTPPPPQHTRPRPCGTCIYFLLKAGEQSHWHRVDATEIWLYHAGAPLELAQSATAAGPARTDLLTPDLRLGAPQIIVPKDHWQSARSTGAYTLVSCTVSPGFSFDGFTLAPPGFDIPRGAT